MIHVRRKMSVPPPSLLAPKIGHNMSIIGGATNALILTHRMGGSAAQIVLGKMDDANSITSFSIEDALRTRAIRERHGFYLVVHGKYIYNFCRTAWSWQEGALYRELAEAARLGADVIIHQGKNVADLKIADSVATERFVAGICRVAQRMQATGLTNRILLENSAHQGTELGYTLESLAAIYQAIPEPLRPMFGFCIDTCHAFVAGAIDWTQPEAVPQFFADFDRLIGLSKLALIHLNDSAIPFEGRNDRHAGLGLGHIYTGLPELVRECTVREIPMILETPANRMTEEIALVRGWANRN